MMTPLDLSGGSQAKVIMNNEGHSVMTTGAGAEVKAGSGE